MVLLGGEDQVDSVMAEEKPLVLPLLSKRESQIMELFYSQGSATVAEMTDRFSGELSRNAIRTFLGILENKGHLQRRKEGREFIYSVTTEKQEAAQSALSKVLDVFFKGSLSDAVAAHFSGGGTMPDKEELARLTDLIEQARVENKETP